MTYIALLKSFQAAKTMQICRMAQKTWLIMNNVTLSSDR